MRRYPIAAGVLAVAGWLGCVGDLGDPLSQQLGAPPGKTTDLKSDPGRVTLHRLNRAEYDNTVGDLLGTKLRPAADFPADDHAFGFDNMADTLTISPVQLELYQRAAEMLAHEAMSQPTASATQIFEGESLMGSVGAATGDAWNLWSSGELPVTVELPAAGKYRVSARVWGDQAGAEPARATLSLGGVVIGTYDVPVTANAPMVIEQTTDATAGTKVATVEFLNDYYDPMAMADRNLYVDWIEVEGPLDAVAENPIRDRLLTCDPATGGDPCVRQVIGAFAKRAFRRPITDEELGRLVALVDLAKAEGDTVDAGIELAVRAVLTSPHFLFRVELDPEPSSLTPHALGPYELASRLSYFLWSSMPDDALFAAAEDGSLGSEEGIRAAAMRMIDDPRSSALADNFAGQWLYTRAIPDHQPDYAAFPDYDEPLAQAMQLETRLFFEEFLHGDRELGEMLTADFTFLNDRLAQHYGLPFAGGSQFSQVALDDDRRGGLLTQASLLTVTSYPARTSPVKRGKWILTQLLCSEPPPPPPGVEGLVKEDMPTGSLRSRLEQHRKDPFCASCHKAMDPLGFALEHYDGVGAFRDTDEGFPIDSTGVLPSGEKFDGAAEMASVVASDPRFVACATRKLFTYALGRGPVPADAPFLNGVSKALVKGKSTMKDVIGLVVTSEPFRIRHGETDASASNGGKP